MSQTNSDMFFGTGNVFDFIFLSSIVAPSVIGSSVYRSTVLGKKVQFQFTKLDNTIIVSGKIGRRTVLITCMNGLWLFFYNNEYQFEFGDQTFMKRFISDPDTQRLEVDAKRRDVFDKVCDQISRGAPH